MIRLENVLKISLQDVLKMSWRRFSRCLEDVLKTSWNVLKTSWRCLEDVFARRLENVLTTSWRRIAKTNILFWPRRLEHVFKTSSEDEDERLHQDVSKTSSSRGMFAGLSLSFSFLLFVLVFSFLFNSIFSCLILSKLFFKSCVFWFTNLFTNVLGS